MRLERTPEGRRLVVARDVDASREAVRDVLTDTERWPEWGPTVTDVDCRERYVESGTTGRVRTVGGLWVSFEVTTCEGYRWTWEVARVPATGHRAGAGRVAFELPVWAAGDAPVCAAACRRIAALAEGEPTV